MLQENKLPRQRINARRDGVTNVSQTYNLVTDS